MLESIFQRADIGRFVLIELDFDPKNPESPHYEILDGKQRLSTLVEFFEGRIQFRDLNYRDMCRYDRHHFDCFSISYAIACNVTQEQKYEYFLRLNRSGRPQDEAHLGKVATMLAELKQRESIGSEVTP